MSSVQLYPTFLALMPQPPPLLLLFAIVSFAASTVAAAAAPCTDLSAGGGPISGYRVYENCELDNVHVNVVADPAADLTLILRALHQHSGGSFIISTSGTTLEHIHIEVHDSHINTTGHAIVLVAPSNPVKEVKLRSIHSHIRSFNGSALAIVGKPPTIEDVSITVEHGSSVVAGTSGLIESVAAAGVAFEGHADANFTNVTLQATNGTSVSATAINGAAAVGIVACPDVGDPFTFRLNDVTIFVKRATQLDAQAAHGCAVAAGLAAAAVTSSSADSSIFSSNLEIGIHESSAFVLSEHYLVIGGIISTSDTTVDRASLTLNQSRLDTVGNSAFAMTAVGSFATHGTLAASDATMLADNVTVVLESQGGPSAVMSIASSTIVITENLHVRVEKSVVVVEASGAQCALAGMTANMDSGGTNVSLTVADSHVTLIGCTTNSPVAGASTNNELDVRDAHLSLERVALALDIGNQVAVASLITNSHVHGENIRLQMIDSNVSGAVSRHVGMAAFVTNSMINATRVDAVVARVLMNLQVSNNMLGIAALVTNHLIIGSSVLMTLQHAVFTLETGGHTAISGAITNSDVNVAPLLACISSSHIALSSSGGFIVLSGIVTSGTVTFLESSAVITDSTCVVESSGVTVLASLFARGSLFVASASLSVRNSHVTLQNTFGESGMAMAIAYNILQIDDSSASVEDSELSLTTEGQQTGAASVTCLGNIEATNVSLIFTSSPAVLTCDSTLSGIVGFYAHGNVVGFQNVALVANATIAFHGAMTVAGVVGYGGAHVTGHSQSISRSTLVVGLNGGVTAICGWAGYGDLHALSSSLTIVDVPVLNISVSSGPNAIVGAAALTSLVNITDVQVSIHRSLVNVHDDGSDTVVTGVYCPGNVHVHRAAFDVSESSIVRDGNGLTAVLGAAAFGTLSISDTAFRAVSSTLVVEGPTSASVVEILSVTCYSTTTLAHVTFHAQSCALHARGTGSAAVLGIVSYGPVQANHVAVYARHSNIVLAGNEHIAAASFSSYSALVINSTTVDVIWTPIDVMSTMVGSAAGLLSYQHITARNVSFVTFQSSFHLQATFDAALMGALAFDNLDVDNLHFTGADSKFNGTSDQRQVMVFAFGSEGQIGDSHVKQSNLTAVRSQVSIAGKVMASAFSALLFEPNSVPSAQLIVDSLSINLCSVKVTSSHHALDVLRFYDWDGGAEEFHGLGSANATRISFTVLATKLVAPSAAAGICLTVMKRPGALDAELPSVLRNVTLRCERNIGFAAPEPAAPAGSLFVTESFTHLGEDVTVAGGFPGALSDPFAGPHNDSLWWCPCSWLPPWMCKTTATETPTATATPTPTASSSNTGAQSRTTSWQTTSHSPSTSPSRTLQQIRTTTSSMSAQNKLRSVSSLATATLRRSTTLTLKHAASARTRTVTRDSGERSAASIAAVMIVHGKAAVEHVGCGETIIIELRIAFSSYFLHSTGVISLGTDLSEGEFLATFVSQPPFCNSTSSSTAFSLVCDVSAAGFSDNETSEAHLHITVRYTVPLTRPANDPRRSVTFTAIAQHPAAGGDSSEGMELVTARANATVAIAPPSIALLAAQPPFITSIHPPLGTAPPGTTVTITGTNLTSLPPFVPWGPHLLPLNVSADGMTVTTMVPLPLTIPPGFRWEQSDPDAIIDLIRLNANATPGAVAYLDALVHAGVDVSTALADLVSIDGADALEDPANFLPQFFFIPQAIVTNSSIPRGEPAIPGSTIFFSGDSLQSLPQFVGLGPLLLPVTHGDTATGPEEASIAVPTHVTVPVGLDVTNMSAVVDFLTINANTSAAGVLFEALLATDDRAAAELLEVIGEFLRSLGSITNSTSYGLDFHQSEPGVAVIASVVPPTDGAQPGDTITLRGSGLRQLPPFVFVGPVLVPVEHAPAVEGTSAVLRIPPTLVAPPSEFNASDPEEVLALVRANINASGDVDAAAYLESLLASNDTSTIADLIASGALANETELRSSITVGAKNPIVSITKPPLGAAQAGDTITLHGVHLDKLPPFAQLGPFLVPVVADADGRVATVTLPTYMVVPLTELLQTNAVEAIMLASAAQGTPAAASFAENLVSSGTNFTAAFGAAPPQGVKSPLAGATLTFASSPWFPQPAFVDSQPPTGTPMGSTLTVTGLHLGELPDFAWFGPLLLPLDKHYGPSNDGICLETTHATITLPPDVIIPPGFNASNPNSVIELILANANASGPEAQRRAEQLLASGRLNATVVPLLLGADPRDPGATGLHFKALNTQPFAVAVPRLALQPVSADFRDGPQIFVVHDVNHAVRLCYATELMLDAVTGAAMDGTPRLEFAYNASEANTSRRIALLLHANMTADDSLDANVTTAITLRLRGVGSGSTFLDQRYAWVVQQRKAMPSVAVHIEPHEDYRGTVHVNVSGGSSPVRDLDLRLTPVNALVATTMESDDTRCVAVPSDSALECELGTITELHSSSSTRRHIERAGVQVNISAAVPSYFALPVRVAFTATGRNIAPIAGTAWLTRDGSLIPNVSDDDEEDGDGHFIPTESPPADNPALAPQETQLPAQPERALRLSAIFDTGGCVERVHFVLVTLLAYVAAMVVRVPYYVLQRRAALRQPGGLSAVPTHDVGLIRGLLPLHVWVGALWPFHFDVCFVQTTQLLVHVLAIFTFGSALHNAFGTAISTSASRAALLGFFAAAMATALRPLTHILYSAFVLRDNNLKFVLHAHSDFDDAAAGPLAAASHRGLSTSARTIEAISRIPSFAPRDAADASSTADGVDGSEKEDSNIGSAGNFSDHVAFDPSKVYALAAKSDVKVIKCGKYRRLGHLVSAVLALVAFLCTAYTTSSWCVRETAQFGHIFASAFLWDALLLQPLFAFAVYAYRYLESEDEQLTWDTYPLENTRRVSVTSDFSGPAAGSRGCRSIIHTHTSTSAA